MRRRLRFEDLERRELKTSVGPVTGAGETIAYDPGVGHIGIVTEIRALDSGSDEATTDTEQIFFIMPTR